MYPNAAYAAATSQAFIPTAIYALNTTEISATPARTASGAFIEDRGTRNSPIMIDRSAQATIAIAIIGSVGRLIALPPGRVTSMEKGNAIQTRAHATFGERNAARK